MVPIQQRTRSYVAERVDPDRLALDGLVRQLEAWLPREEEVLQRAAQEGRRLPRREARWQAMLGLYERLCLALSGTGAAAA